MALAPTHPNLASPPEAFLAGLGDDPRLVHAEWIPGRAERIATLSEPLSDQVRRLIGVEHLWSHQVQAIEALRAGRSVAVATSTASGKSLCYQVPIIEAMLEPRPATALAVFPTKALAQDQVRSLACMEVPKLVVATHDGDDEAEQRRWVRNHANVVATNPEMLHHSILAGHERWATYLRRLRYVVVDELHVLRGVFGSHVAHVLRRLRRLCDHYGSNPAFVFTSGTIGDPAGLASALCGLPVEAITDDGSPRSERLFVLWNPLVADADRSRMSPAGGERSHVDDPTDVGGLADVSSTTPAPARNNDGSGITSSTRSSSMTSDLATLGARLVVGGHRTIVFCGSRKLTEVVCSELRRRLPVHLQPLVEPYRAGYLRSERRAVEQRLFSGELRAVVATTALELGIDVGGLDAAVLGGFPGTIASMWQQAGRAGRAEEPSVTVLVAGEDQLDQWLMANPSEVFTRPAEPAVINPDNPYVALAHLACAAHELPLAADDERWWPGGTLDEAVRRLVLDDQLRVSPTHRRRGGGGPVAVWAGRGRPGRSVSLRSSSSEEVRIASEDGTLVGTVDAARAPRQVHPGAVYLHQGRPWRVASLDLDELVAIVEPGGGDEYTRPHVDTQIEICGIDDQRDLRGLAHHLGDLRVRTQVVGYRRHEARTGELLGYHDLDLPPSQLDTRGFWWTLQPELLDAAGIDPDLLPGTLHAAEHASIAMLPLFTICDRWDVGGFSTALHLDTGLATVAVHDAYEGGAGVAELGFSRVDDLLEATLALIGDCRCLDGCPSCVQSPKCGNNNEPLDKAGAIALLSTMVGRS